MELRFYIKKRQLFDLYGNPIMAVGTVPTNVTVVGGTIPNNNWTDITDDVSNPESFNITFTENRDSSGTVSTKPGVRFIKKAATGIFSITGDTYKFIYDWIYKSPTSMYNAFSLRVEDVGCGCYDELVVARSSINFCEGNICEFELSVRQADEVYDCIQKTVISDNWQGWFQEQPSGGKQYPRFSYCDEPTNQSVLLLIWFVFFNVVVGSGAGLLIVLATIVNPIIAIVNVFTNPNLSYINPLQVNKAIITLMFESAGCGREHPAPFIRDYIQNVCDKCGVVVDAISAPVFFATHLSMTTSSGWIDSEINPHYNATWLEPKIKKGVRRFKDLWASMTYQNPDNTTFFQVENAPIYALSDFLDKLKPIYNSEWRIRKINGQYVLMFLRSDWWLQGKYIYNFQDGSPDRDKIINGVCFEPDDITFPAYTGEMYQLDPIEQGNSEVLDAYNGLAYNFGQLTETNILFEGGATDPSYYIAPTKFGLDGSGSDYIYDSFQSSLNSSWFHLGINMPSNPFAPATLNTLAIGMADYVRKYVNNAIYLRTDNVGMARIIIWDGGDMLNAKALRQYSGLKSSASTLPEPPTNPTYNVANDSFNKLHNRNTRVRGLGLTFGGNPSGVYEVRGLLGTVYLHEPCELPNFPLYYNAGFKGTLWDWWHFVKDPRFQQRMGLKWHVEIENCCEDKEKLGVFTHSDNIGLGNTVKLPLDFIFTGVISEISVDYNSKNGVGRTIKISGTV